MKITEEQLRSFTTRGKANVIFNNLNIALSILHNTDKSSLEDNRQQLEGVLVSCQKIADNIVHTTKESEYI